MEKFYRKFTLWNLKFVRYKVKRKDVVLRYGICLGSSLTVFAQNQRTTHQFTRWKLRMTRLILLLTCLTSGCAHTAVVRSMEPAQIDVSGMARIAVMDFTGENGNAVATNLSGKLWKNEFYTIVDRSEIKSTILPAAYDATEPLNEVLGPAKAAGLDGVILGEVVEYRCEDDHLSSTAFNFQNDEDEHGDHEHERTGFGFEQNETVVREGTVTIAFRLVDVNTGEVRASEQVSHHFEGKSVNGQVPLPPKGEVLDNLTQACIEDVITMLAPHEVECKIQLAWCDVWTRGHSHVRQGSTLASRGDWEGAKDKWKAALEINPQNHAAMFNLAVCAVQDKDYTTAEDYAMQAVRIEHKECYAKGLAKIRERRNAFDKTEEQRDARLAAACETVWR